MRDYLAALGVPLFVWSIGRPGLHGESVRRFQCGGCGAIGAHGAPRDD